LWATDENVNLGRESRSIDPAVTVSKWFPTRKEASASREGKLKSLSASSCLLVMFVCDLIETVITLLTEAKRSIILALIMISSTVIFHPLFESAH